MKIFSRNYVEQLVAESAGVNEIIIPEETEEIEREAFLPLSYAKNLKISSKSSKFIVENNCLYEKNTGTLFFALAEQGNKICIPATVKKINLYAFPAGVKEIDQIPSAVQEIPLKAAKAWELKAVFEQRNKIVKSKREKIEAIRAAMKKKIN